MSQASTGATVGFIGLGDMGGPMTANLLKAGWPVVAYDLQKDKVDRAVALGAQAGAGPADVAQRAGIVISMVDTTAPSIPTTPMSTSCSHRPGIRPVSFVHAARTPAGVHSFSKRSRTASRNAI